MVFISFMVYGFGWGLYTAALPAIRANSEVTNGGFGAALLGMALTAMPAMLVFGRLLDRFGRAPAVAAAALFALTVPLPVMASSLDQLVVALVLFGVGTGALEVVVVNLAATVECASGVRVLNRAHALFSGGLVAGTACAGLFAFSGQKPEIPLFVFAGVILLGLPTARRMMPHQMMPRRAPRATEKPRPRIDRRIVLLGAVAALAMLVESGAQQWSGIFLRDVTGAPHALASLAPGVFACGMITGRLCGHWAAARISDRRILAISGLNVLAGVLLIATSAHPAVTLLAIAFTGAASSSIIPTIYGFAGRSAASGCRGAVIGTTTSIAYVGLLAGPAVVGVLAEFGGLRTAVGLLALIALAVTLASPRLARER